MPHKSHRSSIFGTPIPLPRGPHSLTREQVAASQRTRLLAAIVELVAEQGYANATITETARRAGVSPNVFYAYFRDKEDCFLAAYEVFVETLIARMSAQVSQATDWHDFITSTLNAYLCSLESEPAVTRAFLIEMNAAGPQARARRREAFVAMAALIRQRHELIRCQDPGLGPLPERVYLGIVHGVRELVCDALESDERVSITALAPDILRWITATIQGAAAAEGDLEADSQRAQRVG